MTGSRVPAGRRTGGILLGVVLGFAAAGCGGSRESLPPTYPVSGSVKYKGGRPVAGGAVQFAPLADSSYTVSGDINDDGSFTLTTVKGTDRVAGAPEGEYRVTVMPPIPADHRAVPAVIMSQTYRVEPRDNTFPIEVPMPAGRP
ncbi:MAG: hypothetical protein JWO38_4216 [Gemmataceae bacterium]|nr:hypothetical protein [Gemmataceae bacterium]